MSDILSVFSVLYPHLSTTTVGQFSRVVLGLLAMPGRVSMLNISRWTSEGGSYRTVQRFFNTVIPWGSVYWVFFRTYLLDRESTYILAGDETMVSKSGESTYGLSRFFSSVYGKTLPGLGFLSLSLVMSRRGVPTHYLWSQSCVARPAAEVYRKPPTSLRRRKNLFFNANAGVRRGVGTETRRMCSSAIH